MSKHIKKTPRVLFLLFNLFSLPVKFYFLCLPDHVFRGHVIDTAVVVDEFECQLKCMGNNSCKSCNVHRGERSGNRICELKNKTRQMKPGDFKRKKGSTYYGSVRVSTPAFMLSECLYS